MYHRQVIPPLSLSLAHTRKHTRALCPLSHSPQLMRDWWNQIVYLIPLKQRKHFGSENALCDTQPPRRLRHTADILLLYCFQWNTPCTFKKQHLLLFFHNFTPSRKKTPTASLRLLLDNGPVAVGMPLKDAVDQSKSKETYCDIWHIVPCRTPAGPEFDCGRWPIASVRSPSAERPPPWRTPRAPGCSVHTSENQVRLLEFSVKKTFLKGHICFYRLKNKK